MAVAARKREYALVEERAIETKQKPRQRSRSKFSTGKFLTGLAIVFVMCVVLVSRNSIIQQTAYDINRMNREINELRVVVGDLEWRALALEDLTRVEIAAKESLGMIPGENYRVAVVPEISMPESSQYSTVIELGEKSSAGERTMIASVNTWLFNWLTGGKQVEAGARNPR